MPSPRPDPTRPAMSPRLPPAAPRSKAAVISFVALLAANVISTLIIRTSRLRAAAASAAGREVAVPSAVVVVSELLKIALNVALEWRFSAPRKVSGDNDTKYLDDARSLLSSLFYSRETLQLLIPGALYVIQNNLLFLALGHLPVPVFQVFSQGKLIAAALCSRLLLGRRFSWTQYASLLLLAAGVAITQCSVVEETVTAVETRTDQHRALGLAAVLASTATSGLAGAYFERLLKRQPPPGRAAIAGATAPPPSVYARNAQLALWGAALGTAGAVLSPGGAPPLARPLAGFTPLVWAVAVSQALGGLTVSLVIVHADVVVKVLATSLGLVASTGASAVLFGTRVDATFVGGAAVVLVGVAWYGGLLKRPAAAATCSRPSRRPTIGLFLAVAVVLAGGNLLYSVRLERAYGAPLATRPVPPVPEKMVVIPALTGGAPKEVPTDGAPKEVPPVPKEKAVRPVPPVPEKKVVIPAPVAVRPVPPVPKEKAVRPVPPVPEKKVVIPAPPDGAPKEVPPVPKENAVRPVPPVPEKNVVIPAPEAVRPVPPVPEKKVVIPVPPVPKEKAVKPAPPKRKGYAARCGGGKRVDTAFHPHPSDGPWMATQRIDGPVLIEDHHDQYALSIGHHRITRLAKTPHLEDRGELHAVLEGVLRFADTDLRALGIDYVLWSGTLLGAHRHHGFIPWDNDVDVALPYADTVRLREALVERARTYTGAGGGGPAPRYQWIVRAGKDSDIISAKLTDLRYGYYVDVMNLELDDWSDPAGSDMMFSFFSRSSPMCFPRAAMFPTRPCLFGEHVYKCPQDPVAVLKKNYSGRIQVPRDKLNEAGTLYDGIVARP